MLCKVFCACCNGINGVIVTVEVDVSPGISFYLVGLPDSAVKESQQRIGAALNHYGYRIPGRKIIINMAPADMKKEGSSFDITIAVGILCASGQITQDEIPQERLSRHIIMGELALDGSLRRFPGALPIAAHAAELGFEACIFPEESAEECSEVENITIFKAKNIKEVIDILRSPEEASHYIANGRNHPNNSTSRSNRPVYEYDFGSIKGQTLAKSAMEIAAAGSHNIILIGSPGCGKTLISKCLPSILPPLTRQEALETSKIYSVSGLLQNHKGFIKQRPFRSPHHTATVLSLAGGGNNGSPGEISLAHNGVLFLDEFSEFSRSAIEILRQPMEEGIIQISRVKHKYTYPANFMLVASMNPCPCGFYGSNNNKCRCSSSAIMKYLAHLSGPILDRIDLQIFLKPVQAHEMAMLPNAEKSAAIAERVAMARERQYSRFKNEPFCTNSGIPASKLEHYCKTGSKERDFIVQIMKRLNLSARSYSRLLKISRTIADLDGKDFISLEHISKALHFRNLDRFLTQ